MRETFQKMPKFYLEIEVGTGRFAEKLETDFGVDPSRGITYTLINGRFKKWQL